MAFGDHLTKRNNTATAQHLEPKKGIYLDGWHFKPDDKWKLVSHLHKSIRHGKAHDAALAAKWIYALDPAYARYRMAVIAFEDVAGGSPEVVIDSMSQGWKKDDIERLGGSTFLVEQAIRWAESIKDRTANDWVSCTRWVSEYLTKYNVNAVDEQSIEDALEVAWDSSLTWWEQGIAAWRVAGTKRFPNHSLGKFDGDWDMWIQSCRDKGVSELMITCMELGTATQKEGSPIFLPFVDIAFQTEEVKQVDKSSSVLDLGYVGPYCSASIDKHTSEGKKAIDDYILNNTALSQWLVWKGIDFQIAADLVGRIQFWVEGGVLNKHYVYPTMKNINNDIKKRVQERTGINGSDFFSLVNDTQNWHLSRKKIVKL